MELYFTGNAPETTGVPFNSGIGYYPANDNTWTEEARSKLAKGTDFTWIACHTSYEDATCTTAITCTGCGMTVGVPLGHSFTNYSSNGDATCTRDGTKTATCDRCDEKSTVTDEGSALGHATVTLARIEAACIETGITEGQQCSRCEEILVAQEVPAI